MGYGTHSLFGNRKLTWNLVKALGSKDDFAFKRPVYPTKGRAKRTKGRRSFKGRPSRSAAKTAYQNAARVRGLQRSVKRLRQHDKASLGDMTYRKLDTSTLTAAAGKQNVATVSASCEIAVLEAALANLKFFDPATGLLVTKSGVLGTYQRNILFESVTTAVEFRNNYQTPLHLKVYLCKCKDDTDLQAGTAWSNGISDGSNLTSLLDIGQYPSDYNLAKDLYTWKVVKDVILQAGSVAKVSHSVGPFEYDSATADDHALDHQKEYKDFQFVAVITGALGHDTVVASEQANVTAGVDWKRIQTHKVKYNAGTNITFTHVDNNIPTAFTNIGVASNKPYTKQQSYSVV